MEIIFKNADHFRKNADHLLKNVNFLKNSENGNHSNADYLKNADYFQKMRISSQKT